MLVHPTTKKECFESRIKITEAPEPKYIGLNIWFIFLNRNTSPPPPSPDAPEKYLQSEIDILLTSRTNKPMDTPARQIDTCNIPLRLYQRSQLPKRKLILVKRVSAKSLDQAIIYSQENKRVYLEDGTKRDKKGAKVRILKMMKRSKASFILSGYQKGVFHLL